MSIRCLVSIELGDVFDKLVLQWANVVDNVVGEVLSTESFQMFKGFEGWTYVSKAEFAEGNINPGTFWLDKDGKRHFHMSVDPGVFNLLGKEVGAGVIEKDNAQQE